jgi:bacterioferritin-associated ferredoxin
MRGMYVCLCNSVTESDIRRHVAEGVRHFETLRISTGCSGSCGCCEEVARETFAKALAERRPFLTLVTAEAA